MIAPADQLKVASTVVSLSTRHSVNVPSLSQLVPVSIAWSCVKPVPGTGNQLASTAPYVALSTEPNAASVAVMLVPPVWLFVAYWTIAPEPFVPDVSTFPNSTTDQFARCCAEAKVMVIGPVTGLAPIARNRTTP